MILLLIFLYTIFQTSNANISSLNTSIIQKFSQDTEKINFHFSLSSSSKLNNELINSFSFDNDYIYCTCDLKPNVCDINCCCDEACSDAEKRLFAFCEKIKKNEDDDKYCFRENIIFLNNTQYKIEKRSSGLFCIVWDNVEEKTYHPDMPIISNLEEYRKWPVIKTLGWSKESFVHVTSIQLTHFFKFGDPLLAVNLNDNGLEINKHWSLPFSFLKQNDLCDSFKPVLYLKNDQHSCLRVIKDLSNECKSNLFLSHKVYHQTVFIGKMNPYANIQQTQDFHSSNISLIESMIHSNSEGNINFQELSLKLKPRCLHVNGCVEVQVDENNPIQDISLRLDKKNQVECLNVIKLVTYFIFFDPKFGIKSIKVKFVYTNLKKNEKYLRQTFKINFIRDSQKSIKQVEFSGNPGYLFGKPILTRNSNQNLSSVMEYQIPKHIGFNGICSNKQIFKHSIKFGINTRSGCMMNISELEIRKETCKSLQKLIINLLDQANSHFNQIAIYANPNTNKSSDWLPIILSNEAQILHLTTVPELTADERCPSLITGYSINIFYTKVGPQNQPQQKLISFVKTYNKPIDISLRCSWQTCLDKNKFLELVTSVTFVDVSNPIHYHFPSPPVLKLQLPPDFFYPFGLNNSSITKFKFDLLQIIFLTICTLVTIFYQH